MSIPKDLAKKRDEYLQKQITSSAKCCDECASLCKRVSSENGYAVRAFNAGILAALESEHVQALVEAMEYIGDGCEFGMDGECAPKCNPCTARKALAKWESSDSKEQRNE